MREDTYCYRWPQDQYVKLERFDDYVPYGTEGEPMDGWSGYKAAPSKTIIFWIVPESNTRNAGLESGQYDVIYNLPSDDVERISGLDGVTVYSTQQGTEPLRRSSTTKKVCVRTNGSVRQSAMPLTMRKSWQLHTEQTVM